MATRKGFDRCPCQKTPPGDGSSFDISMLQLHLELNSFGKLKDFLVGGLEHFSFSDILGIIIPIDFHIFQGC